MHLCLVHNAKYPNNYSICLNFDLDINIFKKSHLIHDSEEKSMTLRKKKFVSPQDTL